MKSESEQTEDKQIETEIRTVDTLLDRGVEINIPAPWWKRWLGHPMDRLVVRLPSSDTLYEISGLYLRMKQSATNLNPDTWDGVHLLVRECMLPASRIIAYAIRPDFAPLGWRNRMLAKRLRRALSGRQLTELWIMVCGLAGAHDFTNCIKSMSGMRITMPRTTT